MGIFKNLFGKGKSLYRVNLNSFYNTNTFENEINFANQNIKVKGVQELLHGIQNEYREYNEKMMQLINNSKETECSKYRLWEKTHKRKTMTKYIIIISLILIIVGIALGDSNLIQGRIGKFLFSITGLLLYLIFFAGIIMFIAFKITEKVYENNYKSYVEELNRQAGNINIEYKNKMRRYHNKIDDLYLMSLEPSHREIVLMRREQEQQHRERMRLQEVHNREVLEEQKRARQAQEELLEIEKAREERYKKW